MTLVINIIDGQDLSNRVHCELLLLPIRTATVEEQDNAVHYMVKDVESPVHY